MLFSYTLLFAMLTSYVAAAPLISPESAHKTMPLFSNEGQAYIHRELNYEWTRLPSRNSDSVWSIVKSIPYRIGHPHQRPGNKIAMFFKIEYEPVGRIRRQIICIGFYGISTGNHYIGAALGLSEGNRLGPRPMGKLKDATTTWGQAIIGSWYQRKSNRKMEITYDKNQFQITPLPDDYKGEIELPFNKPKGLVRVTAAGSEASKLSFIENTAACYLAAAGGQWKREADIYASQSGPGDAKGRLYFEVQRDLSEKMGVLKIGLSDTDKPPSADKFEDALNYEKERGKSPVAGYWRRVSRVPSAGQGDLIEIVYKAAGGGPEGDSHGGFFMEILELARPTLPKKHT